MRRPIETGKVDETVTKNPNPTRRKRNRETSHTPEDYYEVESEELCAELGKERPKKKIVRKLMKSTFLGRRQWITTDQPIVTEVLKKFPCLSQSRYVSNM